MQNYLCRETKAKGQLYTEFMLDELSQAAALASVCMQNMSLPRRNALGSQYILFKWPNTLIYKTSEVQN